jgi:hypothetical protein
MQRQSTLAYFPYFEEIKLGLWDHLSVSLYLYLPKNIWMAEPIFMKLGMYIMTPKPISTA